MCVGFFFFFTSAKKKKKKVGSGFSCKAATVKRVFFFLCRSTPFQGLKWRSNKRRNDNIPLWLSALCAVERVYKERMKELRLAFSCFPFFFFQMRELFCLPQVCFEAPRADACRLYIG